MTKLDIIKALLFEENKTEIGRQDSFFECGKIYAFRSVTMIYVGRLVDINSKELLIDEAAWIPETERWADFVSTGAHKEAEPYKTKVILNRDSLLDSTEIPSVIRKQK
jgi:hypothetical protein